MKVREIEVKSILTKSRIPTVPYVVNPYTGCGHNCKYCYATFMKRFTGHSEAWGSFVDAKINAPQVLDQQLERAKKDTVLLSSVCDPYQPVEKEYKLTRECLKVLLKHKFPVEILTKSDLVLRDLNLLKQFDEVTVGWSITTDREDIKKIFEPNSPPIAARLKAAQTFHDAGIETYAFVGPILPMNPDKLADQLIGKVDSVLIDKLNYSYKVVRSYKEHRLEEYLQDDYFDSVRDVLVDRLEKGGVEVEVVF
jgi:DNA repair photolyase